MLSYSLASLNKSPVGLYIYINYSNVHKRFLDLKNLDEMDNNSVKI